MKITKRVKTGCALVLAGALVFPGLSKFRTEAAQAVDVNKPDCSITVSVAVGSGSSGNEDYLEDFNQMSIPVSIYRVADVDVTGQKFTPVEGSAYTSMDFSKIDSETNASQWMEFAKEAEECLKKADTEGEGSVDEGGNQESEDVKNKDAAGFVESKNVEKTGNGNASAVFTGLTPGMYLVVPAETYNKDYTTKYQFTPYLTTLPSSAYTTAYDEEGNPAGDNALSDDWVYDTEIGLKPEAEPLYGNLEITKTLLNYNRTLQDTTFVFRVDQYDENDVLQTGKSDVYSITFKDDEIQSDADLSQTIRVGGIKAGWSVVVTEIYTGASYTNDGPTVSEKKLIYSQEAVDAGYVDEAGNTAEVAKVSFSNRYDGGNRGGYGVMNQFTNTTGNYTDWEWEQIDMPDVSKENED